MSDPFHPYSGGGFPGAGGDGGPPRRYSDYEVDLIASRYADAPLPSLSSAEFGYFDAHLGARRSAEGEGGSISIPVFGFYPRLPGVPYSWIMPPILSRYVRAS
jgi:hypothetical protein